MVKKPVLHRVLAKCSLDPATGCWHWTGGHNGNRYGRYRDDTHRLRPVHRIVYEQARGPIPEGLEIDHLCQNHACVNPLHLEAVTAEENTRRAMARRIPQTHCKRGHPLSGDNLRIVQDRRRCRACNKARARANYHGRSLPPAQPEITPRRRRGGPSSGRGSAAEIRPWIREWGAAVDKP